MASHFIIFIGGNYISIDSIVNPTATIPRNIFVCTTFASSMTAADRLSINNTPSDLIIIDITTGDLITSDITTGDMIANHSTASCSTSSHVNVSESIGSNLTSSDSIVSSNECGSPGLVDTSFLDSDLDRSLTDAIHPSTAPQGGRVGQQRLLLQDHLPLDACVRHRGDEVEAGRVDTVPQSCGFWTVLEDMAKVGPTVLASNLSPYEGGVRDYSKEVSTNSRSVFSESYSGFVEDIKEGWPTRARVILRGARELFEVANNTCVDSFFPVLIVLVAELPLSLVLLCHLVLSCSETLPELNLVKLLVRSGTD